MRAVWTQLYDKKQTIKLKNKVEDKMLYEHLFYHDKALDYEYAEGVINKYLSRWYEVDTDIMFAGWIMWFIRSRLES